MLFPCKVVSPPAATALETPALPAKWATWDSTLGAGTKCDATDTVDETHVATGATPDAALEVFLHSRLRVDKELFASPSAQQHTSGVKYYLVRISRQHALLRLQDNTPARPCAGTSSMKRIQCSKPTYTMQQAHTLLITLMQIQLEQLFTNLLKSLRLHWLPRGLQPGQKAHPQEILQ